MWRSSAVAALVLVLAACSGPSGSGNPASDTQDAEATSGTASESGSRDAPFPLGKAARVGDWTVAVTEVVPEATAKVAASNPYNEKPAAGHEAFLFNVKATYRGEGPGDAYQDIGWAFVGSKGNIIEPGGDKDCGDLGNDLPGNASTFAGGTVEGELCVFVPSNQVAGSTVMATTDGGDDGVFWASN